MKAKPVFSVGIGLSLLVAAASWGARKPAAQAVATGPVFEAVEVWAGDGTILFVIGRTFYTAAPQDNWLVIPHAGTIPGEARVAALSLNDSPWGGPFPLVVLENGEVYMDIEGPNPQGWVLLTNVFGAPISTKATSWGGLKENYRK